MDSGKLAELGRTSYLKGTRDRENHALALILQGRKFPRVGRVNWIFFGGTTLHGSNIA